MKTDNFQTDWLDGASLAEAGGVLDAAFGRQGMTGNLRFAYELQPESWLCARRDGRIIGLVGAYNYGPVASIGMMAVHPSVQRQRVGETLLAALIDALEGRGCPVLFLDASAAGQRLYPKLGFVAEGETLRMARKAAAGPTQAVQPDAEPVRVAQMERGADVAELAAFDAPIFGADRRAILGAYAASSAPNVFAARGEAGALLGYLMVRGNHVGPWAARSPAAAAHLLGRTLALPSDTPLWLTCPAENSDAMALLSANGFAVMERLLHMRRGGVGDPRETRCVYGQASLTLG